MMIAKDKSDTDSQGICLDDSIRNNCPIHWADYAVSGDIEEIIDVIQTHGLYNISVVDIGYVLSTTYINYVTTGYGIGPNRTIDALNNAIDEWPFGIFVALFNRMIIYVWAGNEYPFRITEAQTIVDFIDSESFLTDVMVGTAVDPNIMKDEIRMTLIAAV